jgi:acetyl-CoA carboxylase carboxyl transferase subunit beta
VTDRLTGAEFIDTLVDASSFASWSTPIAVSGHSAAYAEVLRRAGEQSGADESVLVGRARIGGEPVALIVGEFGFLGGSIGTGAAKRVADAFSRATHERLPVLAAPCSGGIRMQEGTPAFVELAEIARAVAAHKAARLPYLVYLRHPTTGGVFASWGSLGHVTWAEPGALIGFLGPRVVKALRGTEFSPGVQRADNLAAHGVIDAVVEVGELAAKASTVLRLARRPRTLPLDRPFGSIVESRAAVSSVWESVMRTRHPDRPGSRDLLDQAAGDVVMLSGTKAGELGAGMLLALASFDGESCVFIGQDRQSLARRPMGPAALRVARRGLRLAEELELPVVTVVDTAGAELSPEAEEGALAGEIARCVADFVSLTVPSVSILLGEGAGGGALALLPARRVIAAEHAWLAPLPPEGAAALAHRDGGRAPEMAQQQHIGAGELLAYGIVQHVVAEPLPAHLDRAAFVTDIASACVFFLREQEVRAAAVAG